MPKITQMFAYVLADSGPDDEGVPAVHGPFGSMPLVGADIERARSFEESAQVIADKIGKPIELRIFTEMKTVKVITPRAKA